MRVVAAEAADLLRLCFRSRKRVSGVRSFAPEADEEVEPAVGAEEDDGAAGGAP